MEGYIFTKKVIPIQNAQDTETLINKPAYLQVHNTFKAEVFCKHCDSRAVEPEDALKRKLENLMQISLQKKSLTEQEKEERKDIQQIIGARKSSSGDMTD